MSRVGAAALLADLGGRLAGSRILTDPSAMDAYRRDEAHLVEPGHPLAVLLAETTVDVAAAMRWATEHGVPVAPRGAGSGLAGGAAATEGCLVLSLARMCAIREVSAQDQLAVVEAGVITAVIDREAATVGPDVSARSEQP